jgi:prepilin-type N-terminal cleavage/methylation domain-containing protein
MNSNKHGFTLVEVLVALTLLGLIATMVVAGTRLGLDLAARGNANTDSLRIEYLQRNVRMEHFAFEGRSDSVRFVSRYGLKDGPDSLPRWVDIRPASDADPHGAIIAEEHRILPPDNQPETTAAARIEILNCAEVRFEYLDRSGETPAWISTWDAAARKSPLPSALRMECKTPREPMRMMIPLDYYDSGRQGLSFQ